METTKYLIHLNYKGDQTVIEDEFHEADPDIAFEIACDLYEVDGITVESIEKED